MGLRRALRDSLMEIDRRPLLALVLALSALTPSLATAEASFDLSGFGTLGGAMSDQDFTYQRFIRQSGTLNRDSVIGVQIDARLGDAWGLTLQGKGTASTHDDTGWEPSLTWAFLSWRPTNDWLLRAGRLRVPLLLYSANNDVGTTFDFLRLPTEVYSVTPTPDINGFSFAKTWLTETWEWTLEGYVGAAHSDWRFYLRDGLQPSQPAGALYQGLDMRLGGLVLSLRLPKSYWRIGAHTAQAEADYGPIASNYPYVRLAPGLGYYQTLDALPGPGVPTIETLVTNVFTLGAEVELPHDLRLVGELVRRKFDNITLGPDVKTGYIGLLRPSGRWTPYAYWSWMRSADAALDRYTQTNSTRLPSGLPNADVINAAQVLGADFIGAFDQQSFAIGAAYSPKPSTKIKAEWMHVRTGEVSSFVDSPAGEDSGGRQVNVFSLSYSFTF